MKKINKRLTIILPLLFLPFTALLSQGTQSLQTIKTPSILPYYSFKNGLGIANPDSTFSINIRFRIQNRFLMNTASNSDFSPSGFEARVRRCRLSFTGHVLNPKWSYYMQISFSRGDMDWSVADQTAQNLSPNVVRDAMIFYKPNKHLQLALGQGKLPGNRQRVVSSGALQFYDRSPVNAIFTTDRDFGGFVNYTLQAGKCKTILKSALTTGEGRNSNYSNPGLAYTGRLEILPLGDFTENGDYFEGDVIREEHPKISLAGGYHFNDLAVRTQGQLGKDLYSPRSFQTYFTDILLKYKGIAISTEYMNRAVFINPITRNSSGATRTIITGDGINTQISYCFPSRWELALRHSLITPNKQVIMYQNQINEYGLGITHYLVKHKFKTQFNVFYHDEQNLKLAAPANSHFFAVFQIEMGI